MTRLPPQVAVFDTAFLTTMPAAAYTYALPANLAQKEGLRRYGAHGTSYRYLVGAAARLLGRPASQLNMIIGHIGPAPLLTWMSDCLLSHQEIGWLESKVQARLLTNPPACGPVPVLVSQGQAPACQQSGTAALLTPPWA